MLKCQYDKGEICELIDDETLDGCYFSCLVPDHQKFCIYYDPVEGPEEDPVLEVIRKYNPEGER